MALQGSFDDALLQADVLRDGWERAGRPAAGWMAPSIFAAAMVHGVRGDDSAYDKWRRFAESISQSACGNGFGLFVELRVALHRGNIEGAVQLASAPRTEAPGFLEAT